MGDDYQLTTTSILTQAVRVYPEQEIVYRDAQAPGAERAGLVDTQAPGAERAGLVDTQAPGAERAGLVDTQAPGAERAGRTGAAGFSTYTYADMYLNVSRIAGALTGMGARPGDVIGVLDWNSRRFNELYWAIPGIGAVMLQMNLRLGPADLAYVAEDSGVTRVFVDETLLPVAEALEAALPGRIEWILMSEHAEDVQTTLPTTLSYEDLLAAGPDEVAWPDLDERSAYSACYTTGTTGRPKGVYYSHRSIVLHTMAVAAAYATDDRDTVALITPMFHASCWGLPQVAVYGRARLVLPGRFQMTDAPFLVSMITDHGVTVANGAPAIFGPMLEYIKTLDVPPDFSRARLISGATEPPLSMIRGYVELTGANVIHGYGATETSPLAAVNLRLKESLVGRVPEDEAWERRRCQGLPPQGVDLRLMGPDGEFLPHDGQSVGEVVMRGPWITSSYHRLDKPDGFRDGYWRSGDVGVIDRYGYLKVTDRIKDVVKSGGEWISSIDMENRLISHPKIAEVAVIGAPHPKWQERPLPVIVPTEGTEPTLDEVREWLAPAFANWQLPDAIALVGELPHTSVGKLNKKVLRTDYSGFYGSADQTEA
ncbi:long-chain-fatty-acid--CoA ligase [Tsukamurella soli]|uniref:Long-chain fatty acid--CoA ligase n=2 Tax=Tsukamurella soli TaxID=644556 RepID=A0ABP8JV29_9ACTN